MEKAWRLICIINQGFSSLKVKEKLQNKFFNARPITCNLKAVYFKDINSSV